MLNRAEFSQLQSTSLCHMARTLYVFYLQPQARYGKVVIDPIELTYKLISISQYAPCQPNLNDIEHALLELEQLNLIKRPSGTVTWQNVTVELPLFTLETNFVPTNRFAMHANWQPSASFTAVAHQAGLIDCHYQDQELQNFISYWLTRSVTRTQQAWERSFVMRLLKVRSANSVSAYDRASAHYYQENFRPNTNNHNHATVTTQVANPNFRSTKDNSSTPPSEFFTSDYQQIPPNFPNPFKDSTPGQSQAYYAQGNAQNVPPSYLPEEPHTKRSYHAQFAKPLSNKGQSWTNGSDDYVSKCNQTDYSARSSTPNHQSGDLALNYSLNEPPYSSNNDVSTDIDNLYTKHESVYKPNHHPKNRVNKPTLFALATGKDEFESIAPGYTDPQEQEMKRQQATGQAQALHSGYEPLTAATGYVPKMDNTYEHGAPQDHNHSSISIEDAGLLTTAEAMEKAFFGSSARLVSSSASQLSSNDQEHVMADNLNNTGFDKSFLAELSEEFQKN